MLTERPSCSLLAARRRNHSQSKVNPQAMPIHSQCHSLPFHGRLFTQSSSQSSSQSPPGSSPPPTPPGLSARSSADRSSQHAKERAESGVMFGPTRDGSRS